MAVIDSIIAHAQRAPGRTAVIFNGRPVGYGDFAGRIAAARAALAGAGPPRDRAALLCLRSPFDAWVAGLALRSLGVTTVNGRGAADVERLGLGALSIVTRDGEDWPGLAEAAARSGSGMVSLPAAAFVGGDPVAIPPPDARGEDGGHILLTSGTTGVYKKVLAPASSEPMQMRRRAEAFGLDAESMVNVFDFGGWTGIGYRFPQAVWTRGGTAVLHLGPDRQRALAIEGLTHAFVQPQLLADLLAAPPEAMRRNDSIMLIYGGGVLSQAHWREARERLTRDVRTTVGATEIGAMTLTPIETADDLAWHRIVADFEIQVVDDDDRPMPAGRSGVVRIRTVDAQGYLNDPEATAVFFRDGWFYPGDLGVLREDGRLQLQGRVTDVINVMGDKIATTPIETALQDQLGAEAVCVFSLPGPDGEMVHVAIQPRRSIPPDELKAALQAALPGLAAVRVHAVKAFARNHMGKIDRAALKRALAPDADG